MSTNLGIILMGLLVVAMIALTTWCVIWISKQHDDDLASKETQCVKR